MQSDFPITKRGGGGRSIYKCMQETHAKKKEGKMQWRIKIWSVAKIGCTEFNWIQGGGGAAAKFRDGIGNLGEIGSCGRKPKQTLSV